MYKIYLDGSPLFFTGSENLLLREAKLTMELNRFGSFKFVVGKENQNYGNIQKKKSILKIYDNGKRIFRGRALDSKKNFFNDYEVICEGELGFLKDSIVRPYEFKGSVAEYFSKLIMQHNSQVDESRQFKLGNVTVTDPNDLIVRSNINYPDTWKEIEEKLIKKLGGYVLTREEKDGVYIDYLKDSGIINKQEIRFGENLIESGFEDSVIGKDIVTCIIPTGAKLKDEQGNDTDKRLDITSVNGGIDYVEDVEAVKKYGRIYKTMTWDDVTDANNLIAKARKALSDNINLNQSIKLSAVDLHLLNTNIQSFQLFNYTRVVSVPHNINQLFLVRKIDLDLLNSTTGILTLGDEKKSFVDKTVEDKKGINGLIIDTQQKNDTAIEVVRKQMHSELTQTSEEIKGVISEEYYKKTDIDSKEELINSSISQLHQKSDSISASVSQVEKGLEDSKNGITELNKRVDASITSKDVQIQIQNELLNGVDHVVTKTGFKFDENGMEVSKNNSEMSTLITENGMKVSKNKQVMLIADKDGVDAVNLHASTYLIIGNNSRFEDYGADRTGCFWIGR